MDRGWRERYINSLSYRPGEAGGLKSSKTFYNDCVVIIVV